MAPTQPAPSFGAGTGASPAPHCPPRVHPQSRGLHPYGPCSRGSQTLPLGLSMAQPQRASDQAAALDRGRAWRGGGLCLCWQSWRQVAAGPDSTRGRICKGPFAEAEINGRWEAEHCRVAAPAKSPSTIKPANLSAVRLVTPDEDCSVCLINIINSLLFL